MRISDWSSDVCSSDLPHFQKVERSPIRVGVTHHEATAERVVGVDLRMLLSQQAREVGGEARREEFKRGKRHDRACDFLIAVGFLARRKVPFSAEEDFRLVELRVRYHRWTGVSVWMDVSDLD